jgi:hypothetical protein
MKGVQAIFYQPAGESAEDPEEEVSIGLKPFWIIHRLILPCRSMLLTGVIISEKPGRVSFQV